METGQEDPCNLPAAALRGNGMAIPTRPRLLLTTQVVVGDEGS